MTSGVCPQAPHPSQSPRGLLPRARSRTRNRPQNIPNLALGLSNQGDSTHDLLEGYWFSKFAFSPRPVVSRLRHRSLSAMRRKRCKPNYPVKVLDYQTWITPNWRSATAPLRPPHGASASTPSISSLRGIARRASPCLQSDCLPTFAACTRELASQ